MNRDLNRDFAKDPVNDTELINAVIDYMANHKLVTRRVKTKAKYITKTPEPP